MGQPADIVRKWIELYNDGTPEGYGSDRYLGLYAPNLNWIEMPTAMFPSGRTGNLKAMREAVRHAGEILRNRHIELGEIIEEGNIAFWTAIWSATVAVDAPDGISIKAGDRMRIRLAIIIEVLDNTIVRQHEYLSNPEVV